VSPPGLLDFEWRLPPGVRAAFTTRQGGASAAPWDSFNLGVHVKDAHEAVSATRARLKSLLSLPSEPLWLSQVHGVDVFDLDKARDLLAPPTADAAIAHERGRVCAIMVADCLPVLFASRDGSRIGAAHAGWRGLCAGVIEAAIDAMRLPGERVLAWLGPAIGPAHYEVGEEVRAAFLARDARAAAAFVPSRTGHWRLDLYAVARQRLADRGVTRVHGGGFCTYADAARFPSWRRERTAERFAAFVWLESRSP
jgi:YfiH family protein